MDYNPPRDPTSSLLAHLSGDPAAADRLLPLVYEELRGLASKHMRSERQDHTLQATALVHEAFLRLVDGNRVDWQGRTHFLAMAALTLRRVLVDHARARAAKKRGGRLKKVTLAEADAQTEGVSLDILALDEALEKLSRESPRQSKVVELRFFGGLTYVETGAALGIAERTVKEDWAMARAWLHRELAP